MSGELVHHQIEIDDHTQSKTVVNDLRVIRPTPFVIVQLFV